MMKAMAEKWARNEKKLREALKSVDVNTVTYKKLAILTFDVIWNEPEELCPVCIESIAQLGERDYSGDLVFVVPMDKERIEPATFFLTHIGYGSCSGCDALYGLMSDYDELSTEQIADDLLYLCRSLALNTIFPYNIGWWHQERYDTTEVKV